MNREKPGAGGSLSGAWPALSLLLCCSLLFAAGCTGPQQVGVKENDTVRVFYTASFQDGTQFDSNVNMTPLEFTVGSGSMIPGFDEAVKGMTPGQTKTVVITPEQGYGRYNDSLVFRENQEEVDSFIREMESQGNLFVFSYPGIGSGYTYLTPDGDRGYIQMTNITGNMVTVDLNNPLAGKNLVFEITLVEIVKQAS